MEFRSAHTYLTFHALTLYAGDSQWHWLAATLTGCNVEQSKAFGYVALSSRD
jgi:hypothetical protein